MNLNRYLDHTVLIPELSSVEAETAIRMGVEYDVRTVCVRPCDIERAKILSKGSQTGVATVLSFPHGNGTPLVKAKEAEIYANLGVAEVDMVANYGWLISGRLKEFEKDIKGVHKVLKSAKIPLKVILETGVLELAQIQEATRICAQVGVEFVQTSTVFNGGGSTVEAVQKMLDTAKGKIKVKPSGGIRSYDRATLFIDMGCPRIGVNYIYTLAVLNGEMQPAPEKWGY